MSFADTTDETRERFAESLQLINALDASEKSRATPATNIDKALRGLALVSIYAAVERAVNSAVEQALNEISSHGTPSASCAPAILSIFHFGNIQAIRDCGIDKTILKAITLLSGAFSQNPIAATSNPLLLMLQNVDATSIVTVTQFFGINGYSVPATSAARLNNLRERRNAISHGREAASIAGEPFTTDELRNVYICADAEISRFIETMRTHCESKGYIAA